MANFKERYLAGEIEFEEIDDYVDEWNNSDDIRTLAQFLGLVYRIFFQHFRKRGCVFEY